jgi:hypothetical protein
MPQNVDNDWQEKAQPTRGSIDKQIKVPVR